MDMPFKNFTEDRKEVCDFTLTCESKIKRVVNVNVVSYCTGNEHQKLIVLALMELQVTSLYTTR